jgi:hypothetical protein
MMIIENKFNLGDSVYLSTDSDQHKRIVVGICVWPCGIKYELGYGSITTWHHEIEMSIEKDVIIATTN